MNIKECVTVLFGCFLYMQNSCVGYSQYLLSGTILPLAVLTYIIQHQTVTLPASSYRCEDSGLWCSVLMLAISYIVEHEGNIVIRILAPLTLLCYMYTRCSPTSWRLTYYIAVGLLSLHAVITSRMFYRETFSIILIGLCSVLYIQLLYKIPELFRRSFTFGELSILLQLYVCEVYLVLQYFSGTMKMNTLEKVSAAVFIGVHVMVGSCYTLSRRQYSQLYIWVAMVTVAVSYILVSIGYHFTMKELCVLLQQVIFNQSSIFLLIWWVLWLLSSALLVCFYGKETSTKSTINESGSSAGDHSASCFAAEYSAKYDSVNNDKNQDVSCYDSINGECTDNVSSTSVKYYKQKSPDKHCMESDGCSDKSVGLCHTGRNNETSMMLRKYFHVAILCVYIPGLLFSPSLLYVASVVIAGLLILLEFIRVLKVEPVGDVLDEYLSVFLDGQDQGDLILTPIYLMIGCSLPLWWNIKINSIQCPLAIYSGLISVGVGDATASFIGRKYGRHKWPGSKKSLEGTSAAFIAQLMAVVLLQFCGISGAGVTMELTVCILLETLLEAFTVQIDNLVIPVYTWMLFTSLQPTF